MPLKNICIVVDPSYKNNKLFDLEDEKLNRDNGLLPYEMLRQRFLEEGYELQAVAEGEEQGFDYVIYSEMPKNLLFEKGGETRRYLMVFESELIIPSNWNTDFYKFFKHVFTWHDDFVDGEKFIKFNFPQVFPPAQSFDNVQKSKFCTLIAGNKLVSHPLELYSHRRNAIHWFEKNHPAEFDFYGIGWDQFFSSNKFLNKFVRVLKLAKTLSSKHPCYRGMIKSKGEVLKDYKFSICYENARDIPGYITEKIFDCFFAGCVPVYWGANNITDHIPKSCFIDKRDFNDYDELYSYMKGMSDSEYQLYQQNISEFLTSNKARLYSAEYFVETVYTTIKQDLNCE